MAANTTTTDAPIEEVKEKKVTKKKETEQMVQVKLPLKEGQNVSQEEFFSVNFKNYIIKRGEYVTIPMALKEVIEQGELAREAAFKYAEEHKQKTPPMAEV